MKKNQNAPSNRKKLSLSRETLRQLEAGRIQRAAGGESAGCIVGDSKSCFNTCSWQVCPTRDTSPTQ